MPFPGSPPSLTLLALPVLPGSSDAPTLPKLSKAAQLLGVKCRPECEAECWAGLQHGGAQREQSSYLQKTGERGQVLIKEERFIMS